MIKIRESRVEDWQEIKNTLKKTQESESVGDLFNEDMVAYTFYDKQEKIGLIAGCTLYWRGTCNLWCIFTEDIHKNSLSYLRAMCWALKAFTDSYPHIHRLQTTVRADNEVGCRLVQRFGFKPEGILKQLGPDKSDYIMFGRVL